MRRVRRRVRRQDHGAGQAGGADGAAGLAFEVEIGQPVVDQVDRFAGQPEFAVGINKIGRIGDDGGDAVGGEEIAAEFEFRRQELPGRRLVDDGDAAQRRVAPGQPPFGKEHVEDRGEQRGTVVGPPVGGQQVGVEQAAAGIGVDLDQLRASRRQVEVVAHEHPARRHRQPGNCRCLRQRVRLKCRQCDDRLNGLDHRRHRLPAGVWQGQRGRGEELRLGLAESVESGLHGARA